MTIESPRLMGNFGKNWYFERLSDLILEINIHPQFENAVLVADIGSGHGNSTVALSKLCPKAEIHSVDMAIKEPAITRRELVGKKHKHFFTSGHEYFSYLSEKGGKIDIALLAAVPEHQLDQEDGYLRLSEILSDSGVVIEVGDTELSNNAMQQHFDNIYSYGTPVVLINFWQKKPRKLPKN